MTWRLAKSLEVLRKQVNAEWPERSHDSDGTIGDASHSARASDHNPDTDGVVKAMDITHDPAHGFDSYAFADMLRVQRDPRIKYIISNRRIANPDVNNWEWRHYSGSNPHDHHVHISVKRDAVHYDDVSPWQIGAMPTTPPIFPSPQPSGRKTIKLGAIGEDVKYLQRMLGIEDSGMFDLPTEEKVKEFQQKYNLHPDGIVGPYTWRQLEA